MELQARWRRTWCLCSCSRWEVKDSVLGAADADWCLGSQSIDLELDKLVLLIFLKDDFVSQYRAEHASEESHQGSQELQAGFYASIAVILRSLCYLIGLIGTVRELKLELRYDRSLLSHQLRQFLKFDLIK